MERILVRADIIYYKYSNNRLMEGRRRVLTLEELLRQYPPSPLTPRPDSQNSSVIFSPLPHPAALPRDALLQALEVLPNTDGRTDGGAQTDADGHRQTDAHTDRFGQTDTRTDGQTHSRTSEQTDSRTAGRPWRRHIQCHPRSTTVNQRGDARVAPRASALLTK